MPQKSRIGPFALEAPLSERSSSGQVFRAIHIEQKKLAAIRVYSIPIGMTPESRRDFASQLEQLKQLRHPGIVRCYGGGFDTRNAFLAHELVDGDSLETLMQRRGCLSWESALEYGQSLAEALQYAHQMGWIHGRLRPDKLLVPSDGSSIKITDWRREAIASSIGNAPPQLHEAMFSAPEQFDSGLKADEKTDLYGLGAVMYFMLTGKPPFTAERMDQLIRQIRTEPPPTVSTDVFDCPVWLNAIVEQLLAKDPRQRPFGAAAVQLAFKEARRRQVQGVGVLQHATGGFSPLQLNVNRDEAEKVLGVKPKKRKRRIHTPFFERAWVLLTLLAATIGLIAWLLMPLSEKTLRMRAEKLLASDEWLDWMNARDTYLDDIAKRFPDGENARWAKEQIDIVAMREAERSMERNARLGKEPSSQVEQRYLEARQFEQFGDRATALDKYRGIINLFGEQEENRPLLNLARRQIRAIEENPLGTNEIQRFLVQRLKEADASYSSGNVLAAKTIWQSILSLYRGNQEMAPFVELAQKRLDALRDSSSGNSRSKSQ